MPRMSAHYWVRYLFSWTRAPDGVDYCNYCGNEAGSGHHPGCTTARIERRLAQLSGRLPT
jgi:hypothetical protein